MEATLMRVEANDLDLFSPQEDLFEPVNIKTFNTARIDRTIADSAHRALQVCNAQAQLMLAQYQTQNVENMLCARRRAEQIALELGEFDYDPDEPRSNPFEEAPLRAAWDQGFAEARNQRRSHPMTVLHNKLWDEGIDTEDTRSQFELCALQLFGLATDLPPGRLAERAKRLAMEMCRYHEGETPSAQRQHEIDRFMALQAARLAAELDF
ncbi:MAG TPA: hypothetical protein VM553_14545 [Dongiaceae bacterium]|nr:hypothetical protein [Dongiaceae bacterium]